jgi:hypothetical protein
MDKKSKDKFEITEMFCVQIDKNRSYFGCIKRGRDEHGQFVFSRIVMPMACFAPEKMNNRHLERTLIKWLKILSMVIFMAMQEHQLKSSGRNIF